MLWGDQLQEALEFLAVIGARIKTQEDPCMGRFSPFGIGAPWHHFEYAFSR